MHTRMQGKGVWVLVTLILRKVALLIRNLALRFTDLRKLFCNKLDMPTIVHRCTQNIPI